MGERGLQKNIVATACTVLRIANIKIKDKTPLHLPAVCTQEYTNNQPHQVAHVGHLPNFILTYSTVA